MAVVLIKESNLLSVSVVAQELGLSEATIRAWILHRRLSFVRIGRRVLIKRETVEKLIADGTTPALPRD